MSQQMQTNKLSKDGTLGLEQFNDPHPNIRIRIIHRLFHSSMPISTHNPQPLFLRCLMPPPQHLHRPDDRPSSRSHTHLRLSPTPKKIIWQKDFRGHIRARCSNGHFKGTSCEIKGIRRGRSGCDDGGRTDESLHGSRPVFKAGFMWE